VHQMMRRPTRDALTASLSATVTLSVAVVLASLYLPAYRDTTGGASLVATVSIAAGVAALVAGPQAPPWLSVPALLVVATGTGWIVGRLSDIGQDDGAVLGLSAGIVSGVAVALVRRASGHDTLTGAALPIAFAGPAAYVLGRLLVG
jgi:hypothetical protein